MASDPMRTEHLKQYCTGPLWVEQQVPEDLGARLASVGAGGSRVPAASFVVTPELLSEPAKQPPLKLIPFRQALEHQQNDDASLEFAWEEKAELVPTCHGFISAIVTAWSGHLPLVLKAEHLWQLLLQGIAAHVDMDPEGARNRFVDFAGKKTLEIRRDHFVKGSPTNDWGGAVDEFGARLSKHVRPEPQRVFGVRFSEASASRAGQLCSQLSAMAMCKHYFNYLCHTMCGFPTVTLLGTLHDWQLLRQKAEQGIQELCEPGFAKTWLEALLPALDRFLEAYQGRVDAVFWNSMVKRGGRRGSGGFTGYTGWFNVFFPLIAKRANPLCVPYSESADYALAGLQESWAGMRDGGSRSFKVQSDRLYPDGTDKVPLTWAYYDLEFPMEFVSGFVGHTQDPETRAVTPVLSWYLLDKTPGVKVKDENLEDTAAALESLRVQLHAAGA